MGDLRRDMWLPIKWAMKAVCKPREIRPGFESSINAAYTPKEIGALLSDAAIQPVDISSGLIGITIVGRKEE